MEQKKECTEIHTKRRSANKMSQMPIDFNHYIQFQIFNIFFSNIAYSASYHDENIQKQNIKLKSVWTSDASIPMHKDFLVRYLSDVVKNYHCRGIDRPCKFLLFEKELNIF